MRATVLGLTVLLSVSGAVLPAQDAPQPAQRPTFRTGTRLVEVSVVVYDRYRKPVNGLKAEDFRLYDAGREQRIELFSSESDRIPASAVGTAPAKPNEFSNRLEGVDGGVTVILFDRLNTAWADQVLARKALVQFLEQFEGGDRIGLYLLDGDGIRVLHDFTSDTSSLVQSLARYRAMTSTGMAAIESAAATDDAMLSEPLMLFLGSSLSRMDEFFNGIRAQVTMEALESTANRLSGIRGRKNLLWVSSGFPLQALTYRGLGMTVEINRVTRALNNANVATYSVDARGLIGAFAGPPGARRPVFTTLQHVFTNLDILQITAEETGGRAFYNTNDIPGAVRRAVDAGRATYVLGYYPSSAAWDGKYHPIRVTVNRLGVEVRHRRGYVATSAVARRDVDRSDALEAAVRSPVEATGIELNARVEPDGATGSGVTVNVRAAPAAITLQRRKNLWEGAADLVIVQALPDGTVTKSLDKRVDVRVPVERYEAVSAEGVSMNATIAVLPSVQRLHIIVRDVATGSIGSVIVEGEPLRAIRERQPLRSDVQRSASCLSNLLIR